MGEVVSLFVCLYTVNTTALVICAWVVDLSYHSSWGCTSSAVFSVFSPVPAPDEAPTILSVTPHTTTSVLIRWQVRRDVVIGSDVCLPICSKTQSSVSQWVVMRG